MPPKLNRHPGHLLDHLQAFNQFVLKGTQGTEEDFLCYQFICNRSPVY